MSRHGLWPPEQQRSYRERGVILYRHLGHAINAAMNRRMSNSKKLGREMGIAHSRIRQWSGGFRNISADNLARIEAALDVQFEGWRRDGFIHHRAGDWCHEPGKGELTVTCRSTGNTFWRRTIAAR